MCVSVICFLGYRCFADKSHSIADELETSEDDGENENHGEGDVFEFDDSDTREHNDMD